MQRARARSACRRLLPGAAGVSTGSGAAACSHDRFGLGSTATTGGGGGGVRSMSSRA
jgi:hypothetical protein